MAQTHLDTAPVGLAFTSAGAALVGGFGFDGLQAYNCGVGVRWQGRSSDAPSRMDVTTWDCPVPWTVADGSRVTLSGGVE